MCPPSAQTAVSPNSRMHHLFASVRSLLKHHPPLSGLPWLLLKLQRPFPATFSGLSFSTVLPLSVSRCFWFIFCLLHLQNVSSVSDRTSVTWNLPSVQVSAWSHGGLVAQSCPALCDARDCSPPGSSVHFPGKNAGVGYHSLLRGSSQPRDQTWVCCTEGRFFTIWATREVHGRYSVYTR